MPDSSVRPSQQPPSERIFEELGLVRDPRNPFHHTLVELLDAAEIVGLSHPTRLALAQPKSEIMVHFPVAMDDGRHRLFKGYRVQHNNALGPFKGGIRFHARLSLDENKSLAALTTLKCSLLRIPFGGAMGGVKCNRDELSDGELMRLTRRFAVALSHYIGPDYDVVEPDVGADGRVMGWFADALVGASPERTGRDMARAVTGKPIELGGSFGRERAVGQGVADVLEEMLPETNLRVTGARFVCIGFGTVGSSAARLLVERGMSLVAAHDATGAVGRASGIDPFALSEHVQRRGGVEGFPHAEAIADRQAWATPADVIIVAAADRMVDAERAAWVGSPVLVEAGHAPIAPDGLEVLLARGIEVLPGVLCSAGGVAASYLEWVQNRLSTSWSAETVELELRRTMTLAARRVKLARIRYECDWRTASLCSACERIGRVYELRGGG